ncbi:MAG TPA: hypothetical protein VF420_08710 [Casimicrobiaceae bacterium]
MAQRQFNIVHMVPQAPSRAAMHGLYGYREVIETLAWGLKDIGHEVMVSENRFYSTRINVIVGAQMLAADALQALPKETIIYNFEQLVGLDPRELKDSLKTVAKQFRVWDYSERNLPMWQTLGSIHPAVHVPVGWAPILSRIEKLPAADQDIDALIYGLPGPLRLQVFSDLCYQGARCVFVCGMYGAARDRLIARAKLVLNINLYDQSRIFEIVRVSYLLANAKAVVADIRDGTFVEPDIQPAVAFCQPAALTATCTRLLDDPRARMELENRGREAMERRHISPILARALKESGLS